MMLINLLIEAKYVGLIISLVVIFISVLAICFKYLIRHHNDDDQK